MIRFPIYSAVLMLTLFSIQLSLASANGATDKTWRFQVFLDDSPIGYHQFHLRQQDAQQQVQINAEFDVSFMFINVYSYRHNNTETWQNGCLQQLASSTDDDGNKEFVLLEAENDSVRIESHSGSERLQGCIRSFAYWDADLLKASQLLNAQTGKLIDTQLTEVGREALTIGDSTLDSIHYLLTGKDIRIHLWYSTSGEWLALQSETAEGYLLRYALAGDKS